MELTPQQQQLFMQLQKEVDYRLGQANEAQAKLQLMLATLSLQSVNIVLVGVEPSVEPVSKV